jgi:hypothetical protein
MPPERKFINNLRRRFGCHFSNMILFTLILQHSNPSREMSVQVNGSQIAPQIVSTKARALEFCKKSRTGSIQCLGTFFVRFLKLLEESLEKF